MINNRDEHFGKRSGLQVPMRAMTSTGQWLQSRAAMEKTKRSFLRCRREGPEGWRGCARLECTCLSRLHWEQPSLEPSALEPMPHQHAGLQEQLLEPWRQA